MRKVEKLQDSMPKDEKVPESEQMIGKCAKTGESIKNLSKLQKV